MKYIILLLLFASCSPSYKACKDKFGTDTTVVYRDNYIIVHDTIKVAGESKEGEWALEALLKGDTLTDSSNRTTVTIYRNKNRIIHKWHTKDSVIYRVDTATVKCKELTTNTFERPSIIKWWWWLLLAIVLFSFGYFISKVK